MWIIILNKKMEKMEKMDFSLLPGLNPSILDSERSKETSGFTMVFI